MPQERPETVTWPCSTGITAQPKDAVQRNSPNPASSVQDQLLEIAKLLAEKQSQSCFPLPEPGIFSEDLLQFPIWIKEFETVIETRAIRPNERLYVPRKKVKGAAKELVDGFLRPDGEDAYERERRCLQNVLEIHS